MAAPSPSADTRLVVMPGDGIGPEITAATLHVLAAADRTFGLSLAFEEVQVGFPAL
ncbi:MAG TPA: isocitrate/isopropylmalate family dehydrogenase, partial [Xanthobacteraceae bacterium]|nr:isocitrate/isopropylmalate family dehydrogenase [Xanthobacteraceae bacterium]